MRATTCLLYRSDANRDRVTTRALILRPSSLFSRVGDQNFRQCTSSGPELRRRAAALGRCPAKPASMPTKNELAPAHVQGWPACHHLGSKSRRSPRCFLGMLCAEPGAMPAKSPFPFPAERVQPCDFRESDVEAIASSFANARVAHQGCYSPGSVPTDFGRKNEPATWISARDESRRKLVRCRRMGDDLAFAQLAHHSHAEKS
jgi:hypothetical protein